jgi:transmembrane sensor
MAPEPQLPMTDALLGKYLAGEASTAEADHVRHWLTDPANQREFDRFARLWQTAQSLRSDTIPAYPARSNPAPKASPAEVDTDAAWQRVKAQMHPPTEATATPTQPLPVAPKRGFWVRYGRAVAAMLLVGVIGFAAWRITRPADQSGTLTGTLQYAATTNATHNLTLPDGSRVTLGRQSRLTYPATFADSSRDVTLTGEAFFDVAHDPAHPFRIQAGPTVVRVLGTSFGVRVAGDSVRVAVRSGRVQVQAPRQAVVLRANEQATYLTRTDTLRKPRILDPNTLAYATGRLVFTNEALSEVVQTLRSTYGADIRLSTAALRQCRLTAEFSQEPLDAVLPVVAETLSLRLQRDGQAWILVGERCE